MSRMTCPECELLLADGRAEAAVADHLQACATCRALQEDLWSNALALSSLRDDELPRVKTPKRRPVLPWVAAAAAAVLLALIAHQASQWKPIVEMPARARQVTAPVAVTAKLPPKPAAKLLVRRHRPKPAPQSAPLEQPLLVKMLTPDPDVVVYWIVD
jgi:hypothetical protein